MSNLIIKNGLVFDPLNKIEGEKKDILIENGIIVEKFSKNEDIQEINANGKTVIPAGIDIHAHIASQQTNWAKLIGEQISEFKTYWQNLMYEHIAKSYISNGYTFFIEANVFPSLAKQTIFNFTHIPVLDKAMLLNVSNLWALELEYQRAKIDEMSIFLSDLLESTKSFGFKVYNPFEAEGWDFKVLREDITKNGRLYNFSALDVYENLTKANENLGLPHSLHAHIEGYETLQGKKNLMLILERIKSLNIKPNSKITSRIKRSQIFHIAHASAYNIDGKNEELINFLNENSNFDIDLGFIGFDDINPLITSDRRLINTLLKIPSENISYKVLRSGVETEGDTFATFRKFDKQTREHCLLWANALDLALNIKNKWQIQLSLNYPNYSDINKIPEIAVLLMSNKARKDYLKNFNLKSLENTNFLSDQTELSFNDFIIISRASPAVSLGIGNIKGNLGNGADGDINILDINIKDIDSSKEHIKIKTSLSNIEYVIKAGQIIKNKDKIDFNHQGKILWSKGKVDATNKTIIMSKKREYYAKFGSTFYDTLKISLDQPLLKQII